MTPCDLHVLNTPPAFVLSQNQTLRKKFGGMIPVIADCFIFQIDIGGSSSTGPRALSKRAAHNSIFSILFPAFLRISAQISGVSTASGTSRAGPHCQRTPSFEGTKKPISRELWGSHPGTPPRSTLVSRPPSLVAAREAIHPIPHTSTHFLIFFQVFLKARSEPGLFPYFPRVLAADAGFFGIHFKGGFHVHAGLFDLGMAESSADAVADARFSPG